MSVLIANGSGSFALGGIYSRYSGVFFFDKNEMFKTIVLPQTKYNYEFWRTKSADFSFWFAKNLPVIFIDSIKEFNIILDCKLNFDNREWGRVYDVSFAKDTMLVHFQKTNDKREQKGKEYSFCLAFHGCEFDKVERWKKEEYEFDKNRSSSPFSRWIFHAANSNGSFAVAFASDAISAMNIVRNSWENKKKLLSESKSFAQKFKDENLALAYSRASLQSMELQSGLFAGLPWFHQRWARDELISVKSVESTELQKRILLSWLLNLLPNASLQGTLTQIIADSGWLFVRIRDCYSIFSEKEKQYIKQKLKYYCAETEKNLKDGLVVNNERETWMDSIDRAGARIEINSLALSALNFAESLGIKTCEKELRTKVKKAFWNKNYLADGSNDKTIRPNLFIAAYVYPELLSTKDWISCFDTALKQLYLSWGGISTIDISHPNFTETHTGENPKSYHQGDSWFYLNNLAAIVLHKIDKKRYKKYIDGILKASINEITTMGAIGHHAELSSAKALSSEGCLAQAWSAAMFVELCKVLNKK